MSAIGIRVNEPTSIAGGKLRPAYWWAAIGAAFLLLDIYVLGSWILSDKFRPVDPGATPIPTYVQYSVRFWEAVSVVLGVGTVTWIVRAYRRNDRLPALGVFMIAWQTGIWQDPLINYIRGMFTYSSAFLNYGSWSEFIPGWRWPNGSLMPEPLLFQVGMYIFGIPMGCMCAVAAMRWAKKRWPNLNVVQLVLIGCLGGIAFDMTIEAFWIRQLLYSYLGVIYDGSLFDNHPWQFPIYNFCVWGTVLGTCGSIYYFKDDKGRMFVERGAEEIRSKSGQTLVRVLAVGGVLNLIYLTYSVILIMTTLFIDPWPANLPSWLRNGMCGQGTQYECPAKDVPIVLPDSGPLPPYKGRN